MFKPNWAAIAQESRLGRTELRLLLFASVKVVGGKENILPYSQRELAAALGVAPSVISRAMRKLVKGGLMFQNGHQYRLNSRLAAEQRDSRTVAKLRHQEAHELQALEAQWAKEAGEADTPSSRRSDRRGVRKAPQAVLHGKVLPCPRCGTAGTVHQTEDGRWGCLACDQWVEVGAPR